MKSLKFLAIFIAISLIGFTNVECKHHHSNLRTKGYNTHEISRMASRVLGEYLASNINFKLIESDMIKS